ncbi:MAG: cytochrome c oxidase subunit I [Shimia sp.]
MTDGKPLSTLRRHREMTRIWASEHGWRGWFSTVSHTDLGRMFMVTATVFFLIGGILAMLIRAQLATPRSAFLDAEAYAQVFTMHGAIMMFLFAIPMFEGLAVYLLPKMLGTRDLAFPRLTAYGYWCYLLGGSMMIAALVLGMAPDSGWFMYPPLSSIDEGIGSDVWLLGITFVEISAIAAATEITVTILRYRAAGMSLSKMPIFAWYALVTAVMILTGFPPLILGSILLELERAFGMPFFVAGAGGDPLLWQHLFWLFGHPEVYIIFLPAAGALSTIIPVLCRTTLLGYGWIVASAISLAVLSFALWVHHMFVTGIPHMALAFFSAASTLVAVPTAVQIFAWIGTIWKGRPQLVLPMMWVIAFFATFVIGGLTGVMVAVVPFDWQVHDTHFIVAHLHYVLIGGFVFPVLAGLYYWLPLFNGRKRYFKLGEAAFWLVFLGFHVTFLAVHWLGLMGMRRRIHTYDADQGWEVINLVASIGGFVTAIGFALVILDLIVNAIVADRGPRNPWRAGTLEWATMLPPPAYNFASLPRVEDRDPMHADGFALRLAQGYGLLGTPRGDLREMLIVETATGRPTQIVRLPGNTRLPLAMALVTGCIFAALLFKQYWAVPIALAGVVALALRWAWTLGARGETGLQDAGHGLSLPLASDSADPPGWWGSSFLLVANATLFGSLLFGYAFLWTIAPNWPPPALIAPGIALPALVAGGAVLAAGAIARAQTALPVLAAALGCAAMAGGLGGLALRAADPTAHAYNATIWVLAGYGTIHAALAALMALYLVARIRSGYAGPGRIGEIRIVRLWTAYAVGVSVLAMGAIVLPSILQ